MLSYDDILIENGFVVAGLRNVRVVGNIMLR